MSKSEDTISPSDKYEYPDEYPVDKILGRRSRRGKIEYLIKWKGYSSKCNSWEPEENVYCPDLVSKFMANRKKGLVKKEQKKRKSRVITKNKNVVKKLPEKQNKVANGLDVVGSYVQLTTCISYGTNEVMIPLAGEVIEETVIHTSLDSALLTPVLFVTHKNSVTCCSQK